MMRKNLQSTHSQTQIIIRTEVQDSLLTAQHKDICLLRWCNNPFRLVGPCVLDGSQLVVQDLSELSEGGRGKGSVGRVHGMWLQEKNTRQTDHGGREIFKLICRNLWFLKDWMEWTTRSKRGRIEINWIIWQNSRSSDIYGILPGFLYDSLFVRDPSTTRVILLIWEAKNINSSFRSTFSSHSIYLAACSILDWWRSCSPTDGTKPRRAKVKVVLPENKMYYMFHRPPVQIQTLISSFRLCTLPPYSLSTL